MSSNNEQSSSPPVDRKDGEKEQHHSDQPTKVPGVLQVPLTRVHGLGHGPRVAPGTRGPAYYGGQGGVRQELHDAEGNKLEPVTHEPLSAHPPEEKQSGEHRKGV